MTLTLYRRGTDLFGTKFATHRDPPLIPNDVRVRGINIAPFFDEADTPDAGDPWSAMWRVWNWAGRIQPQLDDIAAVGNGVRMLGNTHVVTSTAVNLSTYLARWEQFLDYCVTKNLYVYPVGGSLQWWGADTTYTAAADIYTGWADLLAGYDTIIGVDITNEAQWEAQQTGALTYRDNQPEPYIALLHHLAGIVRRRAGVPVTHSHPVGDAASWLARGTATYPLWKQFDIADFIDIHVYYNAATSADAAQIFRTPWGAGKQLLIGEFGGLSSEVLAATRTARYEAMATITASDTDICGAMAWSCWDIDDADTWRPGLYNPSRVLRTDISVPFATLPTTR